MESEKVPKCSKQEGDVGRAKEKRALLIPFLETRQELVLLPRCLPPSQQKEILNPMDPSTPEVRWNVLRSSPDHLSLSSMSELRQPFLQLQWVCAQSCPTLCNPMDCRHLSHAQHVPGTSLVLNMSHLEQMVPFNNHNEVCIITQTRKQRLFYKQGNRDSQKLKVIRLRSKNK